MSQSLAPFCSRARGRASTSRPRTTLTPRQAAQEIQAELEALPADKVRRPHFDIMDAISTVLGVRRRLLELRPQIAALPGFDLARFDRLELYARAALHAHAAVGSALRRDPELEPLAKLGFALRAVLLSDARALARRKLLNGDVLKKLHRPSGYVRLAGDLALLAQLFRGRWHALAGRTAVQEDELLRAEQMVTAILERAGRRRWGPAELRRARDVQARSFTLLVNAYDDARTAVLFLRREQGDGDRIAPVLARRKRRQKPRAPAALSPPSG